MKPNIPRPSATRTATSGSILLLMTASIGCALTVLDSNIVAVVVPAIARDFGSSFADVEWVISAYVLSFASLLLPAGAIADRYGRRQVFLIGIASFALASLLCGAAPSAPLLNLARALQGAGAAFMLAPALAVIAHAFHEETARDRAWALWGGMMGLTMVLAPVIGGFIAWALGWRWAFYVNVPICILLGIATWSYVEDSRDDDARRLDPAGILLFAATMFGLTWGLIDGQAQGWSAPSAMGGFAIGLMSLAGFIIIERRQERPMLDLGLFVNPRLIGSVWAMFAYAACAQVMTNMLPPFLQNGLGFGPLGAGFAMLPFALAMLVFPYVGRILAGRLGSSGILATGLILVGLGNLCGAWGATTGSWLGVLFGMGVLGSGGGLLNGETQKAIMSDVPRSRAGMASGISTTARFSGILLGYALLSGVLATVIRILTMEAGGSAEAAQSMADAIVSGNQQIVTGRLLGAATRQAIEGAHATYSQGFAIALLIAAVFAWLSAIVVWVLRGHSSAHTVSTSTVPPMRP